MTELVWADEQLRMETASCFGIELEEEDALICALQDEKPVAGCTFVLTQDNVMLTNIFYQSYDLFVLDAMVRAILKAAQERGIEYFEFGEQFDDMMIHALGFAEDGQYINILIAKYMNNCKSCKS